MKREKTHPCSLQASFMCLPDYMYYESSFFQAGIFQSSHRLGQFCRVFCVTKKKRNTKNVSEKSGHKRSQLFTLMFSHLDQLENNQKWDDWNDVVFRRGKLWLHVTQDRHKDCPQRERKNISKWLHTLFFFFFYHSK